MKCSIKGCPEPRLHYGTVCRKHHNERSLAWQRKNPEKRRAGNLARYGITIDQYEAMLEDQEGVCAICRQSEWKIDYRTGEPMFLSVDHDHDTKEVRGLLCQRCNGVLGLVKDDITLLEDSISYVKR